jgi:hypothetical protein
MRAFARSAWSLIELALGLVELNLEGPGIDLREHLPLLYVLAFVEVHADELAVHAAADDDRAHRHHGAQAAEIDRDVAGLSRFGRHGDRAAIAALSAAPLPGLLRLRLRRRLAAAGLVVIEPCADAGGRYDHGERDEECVAPARGFQGVLHGDPFGGPHFTTSSPPRQLASNDGKEVLPAFAGRLPDLGHVPPDCR